MYKSRTLALTGKSLSLGDLERVLREPGLRLSLSAEVVRSIQSSRQVVLDQLREGRTVYGVNTGFGKLAQVRIPAGQITELQENLIRSHAIGLGDPLFPAEARLVLFLRIQALASGYSGVSVELVQRLVKLFNLGVAPLIPEKGSVGASGDLAPLAHMALPLLGEGEVFRYLRGRRDRSSQGVDGRYARVSVKSLRKEGWRAYRLEAKEGLALVNGTQVMTAILAHALLRAEALVRAADVAGAMTLEALRCSIKPFDPRIQSVRPHPGQAEVASNVRKLLVQSEILSSHKDCPRVQDSYSIRCMPQVHGAVRDAVRFVRQTVEREINSATDNPLVFTRSREILSGGNFHGQPVALAADVLGIAVSELGAVSERRIENLVNPDLSGLPAFLSPDPGLNSGMMVGQIVAAALVSENKVLAHPASVDSIPTGANQEDHVSMGVTAATKAGTIVENVERILSLELLCAAQGLEFLKPLRPGRGVLAAYQRIRTLVRPLESDRVLSGDVERILTLVRERGLLEGVVKTVGPLR